MSLTSESLKKENERIDNALCIASGVLNAVLAEVKLVEMDEQASITIRLKQLKENIASFNKHLNSVITVSEDTLCRTITSDLTVDIPYKHPLGSITPTARGFYSIKDVTAFETWLTKHHPQLNVAQTIHDIAKSKKSCNTFFDDILKGGEALPECVGKHIIPKVTIRNMEQNLDIGDF